MTAPSCESCGQPIPPKSDETSTWTGGGWNHREYEFGYADLYEEDDDQWSIEVHVDPEGYGAGLSYGHPRFIGIESEARARADAMYEALARVAATLLDKVGRPVRA